MRRLPLFIASVSLVCLGAPTARASVTSDDLGPVPDAKQIAYVSISPDCHNIAMAVRGSNSTQLLVNGKAAAAGDTIPYIAYSPDSRHLLSIVITGAQAAVLVDGSTGAPCDEVTNLRFSANSKHVYYSARRAANWFAVLDGKETATGTNAPTQVTFSADGEHLAYVATSGDSQTVIVDGKEGESYWDVDDLTLSTNGSHLAYAANTDWDAWVAIVDGKQSGGIYPMGVDHICFSPDGSHIAFVGCLTIAVDDPERYEIVADGKRSGPFLAVKAGPEYSPDGPQLNFSAEQATGPREKNLRGQGVFPTEPCVGYDRRIADSDQFIYSKGGDHLICQRTEPMPGFFGVPLVLVDDIVLPALPYNVTLSPDARKVASIEPNNPGDSRAVWLGERAPAALRIEGGPGPSHFRVGPPLFSPDAAHMAYAAQNKKDGDWCMVLDGSEEANGALALPSVDLGPDGKWNPITRFEDQASIDNGHSYNGQIPYHFDPDGTLVYFRIADGHLYRVHWKPDDATTLPATGP